MHKKLENTRASLPRLNANSFGASSNPNFLDFSKRFTVPNYNSSNKIHIFYLIIANWMCFQMISRYCHLANPRS